LSFFSGVAPAWNLPPPEACICSHPREVPSLVFLGLLACALASVCRDEVRTVRLQTSVGENQQFLCSFSAGCD